MDILNSCPVCEGSDLKPFLTAKDYFLSGEEFSIQRCEGCSFLFTNPRPVEKDLSAYYQSADYISHSNINKGLINRIYQVVRNYSLDRKVSLIKNIKKSGKVLDIGCGTGHFLNRLSGYGFHVMGVEPDANARAFAVNTFNLPVEDDLFKLGDRGDKFDVITMWHVLEHVFDLNKYMQEIKGLLSPNGTLFVAVPNPDSFDAKHYEKFWAAYDLPRHLYHFTHETMVLLAEKFHLQMMKAQPMKFDSFYVSLLSEKYKHGKNKYLPALMTGLKSNLSASRSNNNYSSRIYILKPKI